MKKFKYNNIIAILAMVICLFASCTAVNQSKNLLNYIDKMDFSGAMDYYKDKIRGNKSNDFKKEFESGMEERYSLILDNYNNEKINDEDIEELFALLEKTKLDYNSYSQFDLDYNNLSESKKNYKTGISYYEAEDYENAVLYMGLVISDDINYKDAQLKKADAETARLQNISYEDIEIYDAGQFNNGLASIIYKYDNTLYKGIIDKKGQLKFYSELENNSYTDDIINNGFEYGYSWFEHDNKRYIIDENGKILSDYPIDNILCTGGGYTWIKEKSETSWNNEGEYNYTLYSPNGEIETFDSISASSYDDMDGYSFKYLGKGVFADRWDSNFYFTNTHKWGNDIYEFGRRSILNFESEYMIMGLKDYSHEESEEYGGFFSYVNTDGTNNNVDVPRDFWGYFDPTVCGISKGYILFLESELYPDKDFYFIYDIKNKSFKKYTGKFSDMIGGTININDNYIAIDVHGADKKGYVGLIKNDNFSEVAEPILSDDFKLTDDILIVTYDDETKIYDMNLSLISSFDSNIKIQYVNEDVLVTVSNENKRKYYNYDGSLLFDNFDFSQAINLTENMV